MTSILGVFATIILSFFFYSPKVEESRIVTINKPLMITQERKTPAFALFQQSKQAYLANSQNSKGKDIFAKDIPIKNQVFLSTESYQKNIPVREVAPMRLAHHEIASPADAGFRQVQKFNEGNENSNYAKEIQSMTYSPPVATLNQSPGKKWATLRGKFEVKDGVGILDHIVEIKRIEEGQVRELGSVDLKAGIYSIDIESPQGILIAQVRDRNGLLIGEDQQRFINLKSKGGYYEGPDVRVGRPNGIASGIAGRNIAANMTNHKPGTNINQKSGIISTLFSDQHILDKPSEKFLNISSWSSTISHTIDKQGKNRKITTIRQASDQSEIPLFSEKWLDGVVAYVSDQLKVQYKSKSLPIIIGRVFIDGAPVSGAHIQVENNSGINPIYLDSFMIPNIHQSTTSESGYFMIIGVEPGAYSVTAFLQNRILATNIFLAEENSVSYQNLQSISNPRRILIRSFDAFTGQPVEADIVVKDSSEIIEVNNGITSYRTQNNSGILSLLIRPRINHMPINYVQDARKEYVHIPLIRDQWLSQIQSLKEINEESNTGTIVGFVPDGDYSVYLINSDYQSNQIIFFDSIGNISEVPIAGGGFIAFNCPKGVQEIIVQANKSEKIYSQVFDVESGQTYISHFVD